MRRMTAWLFGWFLLAANLLGAANPFDPDRDVSVELQSGAVVLTVAPGAHLKASFLKIELKGGQGTLVTGPLPPTDAKDELGGGVWHGRLAIPVRGQGLPATVELGVTYQPCTEGDGGVCYPPRERILKVDSAGIPGSDNGRSGLFWVFLGVFGAGLLASLTPCVYPMIPITMAVIGAKGGGKARGLARSAALVAGMAATYSALGVLAARTGAAFGGLAQSPWFLVPVSALFGLFAVSLLGGFEFRLPEALQSRLQSGPRQGLAGAFLMGLVLGPISAPCVGPVIGTVLLAIAKEGKVLLGAAELAVFALGMGVLFLVVGTFSAALPRSGPWLVRLKQMMGLVVLGFAIWTLRLVLPAWLNDGLWSLTLLVATPVLGGFRQAGEDRDGIAGGLARGLGLLALALGILLGVRAVESGLGLALLPSGPARSADAAAAAGTPAHPGWIEQDLEQALAQAKASGQVVVVDTYADWCAQCKELDERTWPDPQVSAWLKEHAVAVRIDTDRVRKDLAGRLGILSYPTVLVLDGQGKELRRLLGFQPPEAMLKFLRG
jgi:thiol:disulfide interchange protein DsbD